MAVCMCTGQCKITGRCSGTNSFWPCYRLKQVPIIPPLPEDAPDRFDSNPVIAICGECGMELHKMMLYSCDNERCPVQRRAILQN